MVVAIVIIRSKDNNNGLDPFSLKKWDKKKKPCYGGIYERFKLVQ